MSLYDELMEMVITEDTSIINESEMIEAIDEATYDVIYGLQEGFKESANKILDKFNKIGKTNLKPEDLTDINKVKAALSGIENIDDANKKVAVKATIGIIVWFISLYAGGFMLADSLGNAIENKASNIVIDGDELKRERSKFIGGIISIIGSLGAYIWALCQKSDYDKLFKAFDKAIYKIDKEIKKINKDTEPDKAAISDLEKTKKQLINGKTIVYKKYKEELAKANNVNEV